MPSQITHENDKHHKAGVSLQRTEEQGLPLLVNAWILECPEGGGGSLREDEFISASDGL